MDDIEHHFIDVQTLPYALSQRHPASLDTWFTNVVDAQRRLVLRDIPTNVAKDIVEMSYIVKKHAVLVGAGHIAKDPKFQY